MPIRRKIQSNTVTNVLTEAGYRCAVPTCRGILAIDIHHIVEVADGGGNEHGNLLPLCPTCHALFHRGEIKRDSIYAWKTLLVSLSHAFDKNTLDDLIFLSMPESQGLEITADGVLKFSRLIASGLATTYVSASSKCSENYFTFYRIHLTVRGQQLVTAWKSGDRAAVALLVGIPDSQPAD